jgi:aminoglycoside phosphotransferase (APT) family kinase protein
MNTRTALPGLDLEVLGRFLQDQGIALAGPLEGSVITSGRSNLTFRVTDGQSTWVVRRPPLAGLTPSAHDVGREYRIVEALQPSSVPVAPTVARCDDAEVMGAPFTVVGFVDGTVVRTQAELDVLTDEQVSGLHLNLIRALSDLHATPFAEIGLADFGRPAGFAERQVHRWKKQWGHVATRELPDLDRLHGLLAERVPGQAAESIVHGDYRVDNTLLDRQDPTRVRAVVDWEMATLGDPLTDVALMCVYQHPDFDHIAGEPAASTSLRWPRSEAIAQDYATVSGRDLGDFNFYLGLACLKLAVVAEGIYSRHLAGAGTGNGFDTAAEAVPGLVAEGLAALSKGR